MNFERRSSWLLAWRRGRTPRRRLFCFPYAGGGASIYRRLAEYVATDTEICAAQLPGHEDRYAEPTYVDLAALVAVLADQVHPSLDLPFAFFGHSMGALVAFELALELRRRGAPQPVHLLLSGRRAPHLNSTRRTLHTLPESELDAEVRALGGTPAEVLANPELMSLLRPVLRTDFELSETHVPRSEPPLEMPFTLFGGVDDAEARLEQLAAWREHTCGPARVCMFPGHHFYLHDQWPALARDIDEAFVTAPARP